MKNSNFWRVIGVAAVFGLIMIGSVSAAYAEDDAKPMRAYENAPPVEQQPMLRVRDDAPPASPIRQGGKPTALIQLSTPAEPENQPAQPDQPNIRNATSTPTEEDARVHELKSHWESFQSQRVKIDLELKKIKRQIDEIEREHKQTPSTFDGGDRFIPYPSASNRATPSTQPQTSYQATPPTTQPAPAKPFLHFESITNSEAFRLQRARVNGGWLVVLSNLGNGAGVAVTFYPDPNHKWNGGSMEQPESRQPVTISPQPAELPGPTPQGGVK